MEVKVIDIINNYLKVKEKLKSELNEASIFSFKVLKLNYEVNMRCFKKAQKTFEEIIEMRELVIECLPFIVRSAFLIGKISRLYHACIKWKIDISKIDYKNGYNHMFILYYHYRDDRFEEAKATLIVNDSSISNEIRSIGCFLLALAVKDLSLKNCYIKQGLKFCEFNYSLLSYAFEMDIQFSEYDNRIAELNPQYINKIKYESLYTEEVGAELCIIGGGNRIGGSCYLLKFKGINILMDAGVSFGEMEEIIIPDFELLKSFGLKGLEDIDVFLLTHAHMDHSGASHLVYKENPNIKMVATEETCELAYKINSSSFKRQEESSTERFYMEQCMDSFYKIKFRQPIEIDIKNKKLKIEFFRAGHILGASSIYVEVEGNSIFYTGDYCFENQRTVKGMDIPSGYKINCLISESTYGSKENAVTMPKEIQEKLFVAFVFNNIIEGKKILIPAFGLGRSQEVLMILIEYLEKHSIAARIYIDGIVSDICEIYTKYTGVKFDKKGIYRGNNNQGYKNKKEFIENEVLHHKCCVVASSGMIKDESASSYYAEYFIEDPKAICILTGYQHEDSPGGRLKKVNAKNRQESYIEINNRLLNIRCSIEEYYLSAHCRIEDIVKLVFKLKPKIIFLVHGQAEKNKESILYKKLSSIENLIAVQTIDGCYYKF